MSSAVDEDTARAINTGRETIGALLSSVQTHLQKVFIVFVIGFVGSFYALRIWIWDFLEATAESEMSQEVAVATDIITRTPFEVILLQAKIGMLVGIILAIPALVYFSRDKLRQRGFRSVVPISKLYMAGFAVTSFVLFWVGVFYAYAVFFPFAFDFLAVVAYEAGVDPSWGITEFTEFIALLTLSFGLAAQMPLFMGVLSYTEIVPYETFRDKWRHAAVAITVFGAMFSPPDPFTLVMWALPLFALYVFSLGLSKVVTNVRRRGAAELDTGTALMKRRLFQFIGLVIVAGVAAIAFINLGGFTIVSESVYPQLPDALQPADGNIGLSPIAAEHGLLGELAVGAIAAVSIGFLVLIGYALKILQSPVYPREDDIRAADTAEDVDFETLEAPDIEDVPATVFLEMEEEEALEYSRKAMYDDNRDKAQAILDRFDGLQKQQEEAADEEGDSSAGATGATGAGAAAAEGGEEEEGSFVSSTAAGMLDAFTEEETTEDDIGGYAYDLAFIFNSLTSKMFYIVGVFMAVLGGTFVALYQGGFGVILAQFVNRVPDEVLNEVAEGNDADVSGAESTTDLIGDLGLVIALHPVEVLIFMVKVSTILAIIAVLPLILYWGWPAARERGLVRGDPRVILVWGGAMLGGFGLGLFLGFYWIAPAVISYLITDAVTNGMIVTYRINSFSWLVIYTTIGVGFLFNIVVTMALFHIGGIVNYRTMLARWRPVVVGIFTAAAFFSPKGILTMLMVAIPIALTYVLGLVVLYVLTGGGRFFGGGRGGTPEPEANAAAE
ncbi:translocase [Natronococcus pandeyae]|uniref:Sec-independent protein translocase protein TatC n=1 Tax=Natronococcus pandeyae TaxID=2055836 RepID=A0A8J8TSX0_9EURY|nr:twin-arginine translocase subunit TatC [Natronococcus pandeyae]TYL39535.1 translocase [Natronococcus pandeyae]